jgi:hypothetical protein
MFARDLARTSSKRAVDRNTRILWHMNFRLVWVGSDEDPPEQKLLTQKGATRVRPLLAKVMYERRGTEMVRREQLDNGRERVTAIANFSARIVRDLILDDDAAQSREFAIEAELGGQRPACVVPATEFGRMGWVLRQLGPQAIIYPRQQQHARAAIQALSGSILQERIFTHLGWRKHGENWIYLQAGGAIGPTGTYEECQVRLPAPLQHYHTCVPMRADKVVQAIRGSLRLLSVAPDHISFPLFAAVYRAPFGGADFGVFLSGRTGTFKTALAALCQQHSGSIMDATSLPGNFASTANALEEIAFSAKDSLLVLDDFAPTGGAGDNELHGIAERVFRAVGNHQGRNRIGGQRQLQASRPPRALILATGEEVPRGQSLRARLLILEISPGDVNRDMLTESQRAGQEGLLEAAMGAYLMWIAGRYDQLRECLQARVIELRTRDHKRSHLIHARLPTSLAELQSGFELWLQFGVEVGAITDAERVQLQQRNEKALDQVAERQAAYHRGSDPAFRFLALLQRALATGGAHIADRKGHAPDLWEPLGWRKLKGQVLVPQGARIGWVRGSDLFLEPTACYEVAQQTAGAERLPISGQTLRHRLREHALLASVDVGRQMLLIRRTLEGRARQVLHLKVHHLLR